MDFCIQRNTIEEKNFQEREIPLPPIRESRCTCFNFHSKQEEKFLIKCQMDAGIGPQSTGI